jgi:hypothetical protein
MSESWLRQFETWHDFYVVVGGSAAGLTGLMFVVVSLGPRVIGTREAHGVRAFVTPTVVFFTTVLVIAAIMTIPAMSAHLVGSILAVAGAGGVIYMVSTGGHQAWWKSDLPRLDWLWYIALPILNYLLILGAAVGIWLQRRIGLHMIGAAAVLFLIIGIRNAWDLVLWMAQQTREE